MGTATETKNYFVCQHSVQLLYCSPSFLITTQCDNLFETTFSQNSTPSGHLTCILN